MDLINEAILTITSHDTELLSIISRSLLVSGSATIIAMIIAVFISCLIVVNSFYFKKSIIILFNSLMSLPPVVVGLVLYILFSATGIFSELGFLYTVYLMIIAQIIIIIPIIVSLTVKSLESSFYKYKEYFLSLNLSKRNISLTIIYEQRIELIVILLVSLGRALSEVGAVIIVGGNVANLTRVMTTSIVLETSRGELSMALSLGIVLLALALIINLIILIFKNKYL